MPKKILLADDSITIQKVVELTFSDGDYEVTAVNNGARAVAKLAEMRPDIILSDIIMPEKNGYEVCEYVKSHPEYRNIPVVLLTGTFEPFDPDRAEKAGCDAVVTKPFESQSLIHKVEELIAQAAQNAASAEPPEPEPSPWMEEPAPAPESPFTTASGHFATAGAEDESFTHDTDIFGAAPARQQTTELPFDAPEPPAAFGGETRAFPKLSFDDFPAATTPEPPTQETSAWDETPADSGATRAFDKMSFDDFPAPAPEPPAAPSAAPPAADDDAPFGAPAPLEEFSSETRAFPRLNFDRMQELAAQSPQAATPPEPEPEAAPWGEPAAAEEPQAPSASPFEAPLYGGETRAFPKMSFEEMQQLASPSSSSSATSATPATQPEPPAASPWDEPAESPFALSDASSEAEPPAFGGETRAFPKMSFDELQQMAASSSTAQPEPAPWEDTPSASAPAWGHAPAFETSAAPAFETSAAPAFETPEAPAFEEASAFETSTASSADAAAPFAQPEPEPQQETPFALHEATPEPAHEEPASEPETAAASDAAPAPSAFATESPAIPIAARGAELTDEQVDRIARRVVELMADQVVRNIAWEIIPDLAEIVVKERIRQLEAEA